MRFRRAKAGSVPESPAFRQCPGCHYDFVTGEGDRSCNWFDCPYLPDDLKVFCPGCNYNFVTGEGDPHCSDPPSCDWAQEGFRHAAHVSETLHIPWPARPPGWGQDEQESD